MQKTPIVRIAPDAGVRPDVAVRRRLIASSAGLLAGLATLRPAFGQSGGRAGGQVGSQAGSQVGSQGGSEVGRQVGNQAGNPAVGPITRAIPSSGEAIPAVGLGTWITFNVGNDPAARDACAEVVRAFFDAGGRLIDSSPMYGSSQPTIGHALARLGHPRTLFSAEKVWTSGAARGAAQMEASRNFWGVPRFDLMQVHNLLDWQEQLPRLLEMKAAGRLRYVGITTSEGRRHAEIEQVMRTRTIDFVQVTYNPRDRDVEQRILPLAQERGIAVLVNRPFREGELIQSLSRRRLPGWASELGCDGWAQATLKWIIAHPAVTCVIPATSQVAHVRQNMGAARGPLPDASLRARIVADVAAA